MQMRQVRRQMGRWITGRSQVLRSVPTDDAASADDAPPTAPPQRTAFVLLGGGSRGAAQAGALTVLLDRGIVPDFIVGVSAGAWNGAFLSVDPTPERAFALEGVWLSMTARDMLGTRYFPLTVNAVASRLASRTSLYSSARMRRVAQRYFGEVAFADLQVPLRIVTTDLSAGQSRIFSEGPLLPAVLASSAIPGLFPPVLSGREVLVDGGLTEWSGCLAALEWGATRVFLIACGGVLTRPAKLRSFGQIVGRSVELSNRAGFARTSFALRGAGVEVIPIFPELVTGHLLDFNHTPQFVQAGRLAAERALREAAEPPVLAAPAHRLA